MKYGYVFFYGSKRFEVEGEELTLYQAKQKAVEHFKPPKSKAHTVHGMLAEKDSALVIHTATF